MDVGLEDLRALRQDLAGRRLELRREAERSTVRVEWSRGGSLHAFFRPCFFERLGERPPRRRVRRPKGPATEHGSGADGRETSMRRWGSDGSLESEWLVDGCVGAVFAADEVTVARKHVRDGLVLAAGWYMARTAWGLESYDRGPDGRIRCIDQVLAQPVAEGADFAVHTLHQRLEVRRADDGAVRAIVSVASRVEPP